MISVLLHTASRDDFLAPHGIESYFAALVENLSQQTLREFELVYVDAHHEQNEPHHRAIAAPFLIKHAPIHPAHRYWFERGHCFIAAAKNTGILHAAGELLISFDDAELFPPDLLARYWSHHQAGQNLLALHKRRRANGEEYVTDHRWKSVTKPRTVRAGWAFAGSSFTLRDALAVNGFNERMDGCKALEDCEFAVRIAKLPGGRTFAMDPAAYLWILDHAPYAGVTPLIAVENHGLMHCAETLPGYRANEPALSADQLRIIKQETIRYRQFDPMAPEHAEQFALWQNTPPFDLAAQWQEVNSRDR